MRPRWARLPESAAPLPGVSPLEAAGPTCRVTVVYTADDLARGQYLFYRAHLRRRRTWLAYGALWALGLTVFAVLQWPLSAAAIVTLLLMALVLPIAIVGTPWLIVRLTARWSARRALRKQVTLPGEHEFAWTAERLAMRSRYGTADVPWKDFVDVAQNDALWLLFISDRMYYLVPRRVLSPEQMASFQHALASGRGMPTSSPSPAER